MTLDEWRTLFELSDRHGFVIAADECYSEIYFDEAKPPLGALQAARQLGRDDYRNLVMFSSLSKRSNVPGMRSGFVAGDAAILKQFLLYRTYHGCAMSPAVQHGQHRRLARRGPRARKPPPVPGKVRPAVTPIVAAICLDTRMPDAGFYLWARTPASRIPSSPAACTRDYNVTVLPGSFLAREAGGVNPGAGFVRIALVAPLDECLEAARPHRRLLQTTLINRQGQQTMQDHATAIIEQAWEDRATFSPGKPRRPKSAKRSSMGSRANSTRASCASPKRSTASGSPTSGSRRPCCSPSASRTTA